MAYKSLHHSIRAVLQQYDDGLVVSKIAEQLEKDADHIRRALITMPDAYIDRWTSHRKQWTAIWCVVIAPENCPKPTEKP